MSKFRQLKDIESNLFDIICELNHNFFLRKKEDYKLLLVALDELNEEYKEQTGKYYIEPVKCANYYSRLWEF